MQDLKKMFLQTYDFGGDGHEELRFQMLGLLKEWLSLSPTEQAAQFDTMVRRYLQVMGPLSDLEINGQLLGAAGGRFIAAVLNARRLESLILSGTKLGDEGAIQVIAASCTHPTLKRLSLRNNNIGSGCAPALIKLLAVNRKLESLGLEENPISRNSHPELVDAVMQHPSCQLYINVSAIDDPIGKIMLKWEERLREGQGQQELSANIQACEKVFVANPREKELSLANYHLGSLSRFLIAGILEGKCPLISLDLRGCLVSKDGGKVIRALASNNTMEVLMFEDESPQQAFLTVELSHQRLGHFLSPVPAPASLGDLANQQLFGLYSSFAEMIRINKTLRKVIIASSKDAEELNIALGQCIEALGSNNTLTDFIIQRPPWNPQSPEILKSLPHYPKLRSLLQTNRQMFIDFAVALAQYPTISRDVFLLILGNVSSLYQSKGPGLWNSTMRIYAGRRALTALQENNKVAFGEAIKEGANIRPHLSYCLRKYVTEWAVLDMMVKTMSQLCLQASEALEQPSQSQQKLVRPGFFSAPTAPDNKVRAAKALLDLLDHDTADQWQVVQSLETTYQMDDELRKCYQWVNEIKGVIDYVTNDVEVPGTL